MKTRFSLNCLLLVLMIFAAGCAPPRNRKGLKQILCRNPDEEVLEQCLQKEIQILRSQELLRKKGVVSASFASLNSTTVQPGAEIAQVDWNGFVSHVNWVVLESSFENNGIPCYLLREGVLKGASGGGVFANGRHVGINWEINEHIDPETGAVLHTFSIIVLNTEEVAKTVYFKQPSA